MWCENKKQGWRSDNMLILLIHVHVLTEGLSHLLNMLSIRVPLFVENRVGNVICGFRLRDIRRSRNSPYSIFSFTLRRLILKAPANITLWFDLYKEFITGVSSLRNSLNTGIVDLGGPYMLQMINLCVSVSPLTCMTSPSHCLYIFRFMHTCCQYIVLTPFVAAWFSLWNAIITINSEYWHVIHVSSKQITLYLKLLFFKYVMWISSSSTCG